MSIRNSYVSIFIFKSLSFVSCSHLWSLFVSIFLVEKLVGRSDYNQDEIITRDEFYKTEFWDWVYAVIKLIREQLRDLWVSNFVIGFIHKDEAAKILEMCTPGTFLLRFSEKLYSKLSLFIVTSTFIYCWFISYFNIDQNKEAALSIALINDQRNIVHVNPFNYSKLKTTSIDSCIVDFKNCQRLYVSPGKSIEKNEIFSVPLQLNSKLLEYLIWNIMM